MTLADLLGLAEPSEETVAVLLFDKMAHDRALDEFLNTHKAPPTEDDLPELESRLANAKRLLLN